MRRYDRSPGISREYLMRMSKIRTRKRRNGSERLRVKPLPHQWCRLPSASPETSHRVRNCGMGKTKSTKLVKVFRSRLHLSMNRFRVHSGNWKLRGVGRQMYWMKCKLNGDIWHCYQEIDEFPKGNGVLG